MTIEEYKFFLLEKATIVCKNGIVIPFRIENYAPFYINARIQAEHLNMIVDAYIKIRIATSFFDVDNLINFSSVNLGKEEKKFERDNFINFLHNCFLFNYQNEIVNNLIEVAEDFSYWISIDDVSNYTFEYCKQLQNAWQLNSVWMYKMFPFASNKTLEEINQILIKLISN